MKRMAVGDNDILTLMTKDSEAGFRMLMQRYGEQTYWHIRRLVVSHADAQDALQETFVRVFRSIGQLSADRQLRSWIYRIATNEALRIIGRRRSEVVSLESEATGMSLEGVGSRKRAATTKSTATTAADDRTATHNRRNSGRRLGLTATVARPACTRLRTSASISSRKPFGTE